MIDWKTSLSDRVCVKFSHLSLSIHDSTDRTLCTKETLFNLSFNIMQHFELRIKPVVDNMLPTGTDDDIDRNIAANFSG